MTTLTQPRFLNDSATMVRRQLRHLLRYPALTGMVVFMPVVFLLLLVYVFGGTLGAGLGGDRGRYLTFVVPGVLLLTISGSVTGTAISVATDMTEGIVARFRTMAIARSSVLTGHVLGSLAQTGLALVLVSGAAVAIGYRPHAGPPAWLGAFGVLMMMAFALTWLTVGLGLVSRSVESASNTPQLLLLLPFVGGGFVPTGSLPVGLRTFARYQPFSAVTDSVRGLLAGTPVGDRVLVAAAWSVGITVLAFVWSVRRYARHPVRVG